MCIQLAAEYHAAARFLVLGSLAVSNVCVPTLMITLQYHRLLQLSSRDMRVLRIFQVDSHPSLMGIGMKKEGFSLLTLLDRCVTPMVRTSSQLNTCCALAQLQFPKAICGPFPHVRASQSVTPYSEG